MYFCHFQAKSDLETSMMALEAQLKQEKEKYLDASNKNTQVCTYDLNIKSMLYFQCPS